VFHETVHGKEKPNGVSPGAASEIPTHLVAVDFSEESRSALACAAEMAAKFDASLTLVHVVEPHFGPPDTDVPPLTGEASDASEFAEAKLELSALGEQMLGPCRVVETVVRAGLAFFEITEAAKALGADLDRGGNARLHRFETGVAGQHGGKSGAACALSGAGGPRFVRRDHDMNSDGPSVAVTRRETRRPREGSGNDWRSHPFVRGMSADPLATLTACAMPASFEANQLIFREGEIANRFYLLMQGRVQLEAEAPDRPACRWINWGWRCVGLVVVVSAVHVEFHGAHHRAGQSDFLLWYLVARTQRD
jgi:hypothetical protein